jgi:hypothetical protein
MRRQIFDPHPDWDGIWVEEIEIPGMIRTKRSSITNICADFTPGSVR